MKDDQLISKDAKEYFKLRTQEELQKLRHRLSVSNANNKQKVVNRKLKRML